MYPQSVAGRAARIVFRSSFALMVAVAVWPASQSAIAQVSELRRLPTPSPNTSEHDLSRAVNADPYNPSRLFQDAWNQPGMHWYANWSSYAPAHGNSANTFGVMFEDPHSEEVPPPPTTPINPPPNSGLSQGQTLGEEPEDTNVQFLRQQSVLLNQGDWQLDYGVQYTLAENDIPVAITGGGPVTGVVEGRTRTRLLLTPVEFRYGVTERAQAFINIPLGWSHSEISFTDFDEFDSEIGIVDVSAGLSLLLCDGCQYKPDVIATFGFTAPTGNPEFPLLTTLTPNTVLGEGYWAASAQLLFIHTYDPIVLFWGFGYRHRFDEDFANTALGIQQDFDPGHTAFYQCGVGFGVNEWVTLSTSFAGAYISELSVDGDRIEGTIREPLRLRFAVTINTQAKLIEPFSEIGMTDDSVDARFGVTWTHTHRNRSGCY